MISADLATKLRGRFIVLDGVDGSGKSTQHQRLEASLRAGGLDLVSCRDPGGTAVGDRIRSVLLDYSLAGMDIGCETMLFMASRAQLAAEVIRPALSAGKTVLCDRYVSSTCAYQGAGGYDPRRVVELARYALGDLWPHLTVILDLPAEEGFGRIGRTSKDAGANRTGDAEGPLLFAGARTADAMEARPLKFHRKVRAIFQELPTYYPTPIAFVDAATDPDQVFRNIVESLERAAL